MSDKAAVAAAAAEDCWNDIGESIFAECSLALHTQCLITQEYGNHTQKSENVNIRLILGPA